MLMKHTNNEKGESAVDSPFSYCIILFSMTSDMLSAIC